MIVQRVVVKCALLVSVALTALSVSGAHGADQTAAPRLPAKTPIVPLVTVTNWTGCYLGVHAGGGTQTDSFTSGLGGGNGGGGVAGGQAGCDAQFGLLVLGVVGDAAWATLRDNSANEPDDAALTAKNHWTTDLALRAGVAIDRALIYGKAGAAWGGFGLFDFSSIPGATSTTTTSTTLAGLLLGGGIEYAFAPHWSARLEYDRIDYASRSPAFGELPVSASANVVTAGLSYRFEDGSGTVTARPTALAFPTKAPPSRVIQGQTYDWTGCYIGVHGGGGMQGEVFTGVTAFGGLGGGQAGCNAQFGAMVLGLEGEAAFTNQREGFLSNGFATPAPVARDTRNRWSADAALRAGVAVDRALLYGKAGAAWGRFDSAGALDGINDLVETSSGTLAGLLLGAGIEYVLAPHWTAKLEFDHIDYVSREIPYTVPTGTLAFFPFGQTISATSNEIKAGVNYQFGGHRVPADSSLLSLPAAAHDWTGCYAGVHAGGGTETDSQTIGVPILSLTTGVFGGENGGGALAGGQAGCNAQFGQIVVGVEGEGAWANLRDRYKEDAPTHSAAVIEFGARENWAADVALRAGVAVDRAMVYGKVGPAWGGFDFNFTISGPAQFFESASGTLSGVAYGGGIEYALAPRWSAKLEFDHTDFAARTVTVDTHPGSFVQSSSASNNVVKVGLNYQFWEPGGR